MKGSRATRHSFSLVEVVVAIGIISLSLIAILSLLTVGLDASRKSSAATVLSSMAEQLAGEIETSPNLSFPISRYFDSTGMSNSSSQSLYTCQITTNYVSSAEMASVSTNLVRVSMTFIWPSSAPAANRQTQTFYLTLPPQ